MRTRGSLIMTLAAAHSEIALTFESGNIFFEYFNDLAICPGELPLLFFLDFRCLICELVFFQLTQAIQQIFDEI